MSQDVDTALEQIENNFKYHQPKGDQPHRYAEIRDKGKEFALLMDKHCPHGYELSVAIRRVEEAVMWANASIARQG